MGISFTHSRASQGHSAVEPRSIDATALAAAASGLGPWELGAADLRKMGAPSWVASHLGGWELATWGAESFDGPGVARRRAARSNWHGLIVLWRWFWQDPGGEPF